MAALKAQLQQKLAQAPGFFHQAPVVINVENAKQLPDFPAIKQLFTETLTSATLGEQTHAIRHCTVDP